MPTVLPDPIVQVVVEIERLLGHSFPFEALCDRVSLWRDDHPLRIEVDKRMPKGMSGYVVPLSDCDLICVRPDLDSVGWLGVVLHEISHLLLGHIPLCKNIPTIATHKEFVRARDLRAVYARGIGAWDADHENQAELLATLLLQFVTRGMQTFIDDLYGTGDT